MSKRDNIESAVDEAAKDGDEGKVPIYAVQAVGVATARAFGASEQLQTHVDSLIYHTGGVVNEVWDDAIDMDG